MAVGKCAAMRIAKPTKGTKMKLKISEKSYDEVMALPKREHHKPTIPPFPARTLTKVLSIPALVRTRFRSKKIGMEKLEKNEPALFLMNHSTFIDVEIMASMLYPRKINIVTTAEVFIGLDWLLRKVGCFPTNRFTADTRLVRDILHAVRKNKTSVVIYPEAGYTLDGTHTEMGKTTGKLIKLLKIPVVIIKTEGAFHHDPIYNGLQVRRNKVSATMTYLLSKEQIENMSVEEINAIIDKEFDYDHFKWQKDNNVKIKAPTRADYLDKILYKCPHCMAEGKTEGKGTKLTCHACGKVYTMDEYGQMHADDGVTEFSHIPDWTSWERKCVREEIDRGDYILDADVDIIIFKDTKSLYRVGSGRLKHTVDGLVLDGCDGKLHYRHKPLCYHTIYADFHWFEIGDMIAVGNPDITYYCFPKDKSVSVLKARYAAEHIYKIKKAEKKAAKLGASK